MPSILIHGPGAKLRVEEEAVKLGRIAYRFGEDGLKVEDAREIVVLVHQPPIYPDGKLPIVIIGPMDKAMPKTQDVLLKSVEESLELGLVLWADDAGAVANTIRSRCLTYWAPVGEVVFPEMRDVAVEILQHLTKDEIAEALQLVVDHKDQVDGLIEALCFGIAREWEAYGQFWPSFRKSTKYWNPTLMGLIEGLVSE